jgi:hypothetical protein
MLIVTGRATPGLPDEQDAEVEDDPGQAEDALDQHLPAGLALPEDHFALRQLLRQAWLRLEGEIVVAAHSRDSLRFGVA